MPIFAQEVMAQRIGYANFGAFAAEGLKESGFDGSTPNPNTDPDFSLSRKQQLERLLGLDWYYGGWMEDRSIVWSDTYLKDTGNFLHLGIDLSVRAGTMVFSLADGPIVHAGTDTPLKGGWGGHVVQIIQFRNKPHALIYCHLGFLQYRNPENISKGALIGLIGNKSENGGWGEHLHLQLVADIEDVTDWARFMDKDMDGYGNVRDLTYWAKRCPDPTLLIFT
jgi:murein DD-endopeptidase MepM/ murein hydrolase activator NlpD